KPSQNRQQAADFGVDPAHRHVARLQPFDDELIADDAGDFALSGQFVGGTDNDVAVASEFPAIEQRLGAYADLVEKVGIGVSAVVEQVGAEDDIARFEVLTIAGAQMEFPAIVVEEIDDPAVAEHDGGGVGLIKGDESLEVSEAARIADAVAEISAHRPARRHATKAKTLRTWLFGGGALGAQVDVSRGEG